MDLDFLAHELLEGAKAMAALGALSTATDASPGTGCPGIDDFCLCRGTLGTMHCESNIQEVSKESHPVFGGDGFRMELDAVDREGFVADPHNFTLVGGGGNLNAVRCRILVEEEGVVTGRAEILGDISEQAFPVVGNGGEFSVHDSVGADNAPPEVLTNALVPQANAEEGKLFLEGFDDF